MTPSRLVMVGNGMAGVRTLEELLQLAPDRYAITVFGAEPHPNYNRILLSPVLAGEQSLDDIVLNGWDWYRRHGITVHAGCTVTAVDRCRRIVHGVDAQGQVIEAPYDRLILATGSAPYVPPLPGHQLAGVHAYRDIADTQALIAAAALYPEAVVIGGGLLGLEAAHGLMQRGMQVTVVHTGAWLLERQLDRAAAALLQQTLEARGMRFVLQAQTQALLGDNPADAEADAEAEGRVRAVRLQDGRELPAQLVVIAAGVRPRTELARTMHLHVERGIVVHDTLQTVTDPRIYAVGECAQHRGIAYGLVAPLFEQGKVLANHLAEWGIGRYPGTPTATQLKVSGIALFSAGQFAGGEGTETLELHDPYAPGGVYKKLVLQGDRLVGACLYGDTADSHWYLELLRQGRDITGLRALLIFGAEAAAQQIPEQPVQTPPGLEAKKTTSSIATEARHG